ncbi:PAS domain-containing protein [Capnocytophaga sp.]|uniref:PAS domain-containing protein n=1 Tax=Capnocytophaga sp. TaxID=44737 RepID=UPI0026DAE644|nr:PAS domain-containing protein [Capnocytophaga sp.]MDO5105652.1 PAS domain-containing protein [Capnocytophaga sp.]
MVKLSIQKPEPINQEVIWDKTQTIVSTTDKFGTITYVNQTFLNVSGYLMTEVIGQPHSLIRHPDTPKLLFKILWDNISTGRNFHAILKNMSKSGEFYWVITDFDVNKDPKGEILSYTARRRAVNETIIKEHIEPLYQTLLKLETIGGIELSSRYFKGFLQKEGKSYIDYIFDIVGDGNKTKYMYEDTDFEPAIVENIMPVTEVSDTIFNETEDTENIKRKNFFARLFSIN